MEIMKENVRRKLLAGYRIMGETGSGATSRVYRVREEETGQVYALKYSENAERLIAETMVLKELKHPCFPRWVGDGRLEDGAYLVMEYIPGITLGKLMENYPSGMPEKMAVGIARDVTMGLACLHGCRPPYIYRDIKADNVMITPQGRARLIDLGAVCGEEQRGRGGRAGTYGYSAPEQFWPQARITPACDIYGMGKLLAYLLTGQNPCRPPYDTGTFCSRHNGIGRRLKRVLERCLQTDYQLRYPDASFLLSELSDLEAGTSGLGDKIREIIGNKSPYRYIKCIWRSEYERIF